MTVSPDSHQATAACTRAQAEVLVRFDHHRVRIAGRWGIMITYPWLPLEEAPDPLVVRVLFNPAPQYLPSPDQVRQVVFKHPLAPAEVQAIVDQLQFSDFSES